MTKEKSTIENVQAAIRDGVPDLQALIRKLEIPRLIEELEPHDPEDTEPMGTDEVMPTVAWEVHGDLGTLHDLFTEAAKVMKRATSCTEESIRGDWVNRRLKQVKDPSARSLLTSLMKPDPAS